MNCERASYPEFSMNASRVSLKNRPRFRRIIRTCCALLAIQFAAGGSWAQVSQSAYRVLGQVDLRRNGVNSVLGSELNSPLGVAIDNRNGLNRIYIADSFNSRVLAWADVNSYQTGDAPTLVLGQPGPQYPNPLGIGPKGFNGPFGLAVDPTNGNLYVADTGDSRVVRYLSPFDNPTRIEPDAVYGQPNFTNRTAGSISAAAMNAPRGVTVDSSGNLWVADTGNHRVLRFGAATLNSPAPVSADTVIGQKDFFSGAANANGSVSALGLDSPIGLAFDPSGNLYVADFRNARVVRFPAPLASGTANPAATAVWGQNNFSTKTVPQQPTAASISGPQGITADGSGSLYVTDQGNNRVLIFPTSPTLGASARMVIGQGDFSGSTANTGVAPLASPNTLSGASDVKVDASGNVFVADSNNHRVLQFPSGSKTASKVWGQTDFVSNGANQIKPGSLSVPFQVAIDYSRTPYALYVSDTANHRVLVWRDSVRFRTGDPADLVIGQPNLRTGVPNSDSQGGATPSRLGLAGPAGIAINQFDGTLYVADSGNNRVLRFSRPVDQSGRIAPDGVIGQVDFTSSASANVSASSLNAPAGLAIGPTGNLFVADTGNNRVLEYPSGAGNGAAAIRVYGQPGMTTSIRQSQVSPQTLSGPQAVAVDQASSLYVADSAANRVLIFSNTQSAPPAGASASYVIGQSSFGSTSGNFRNPSGVAVDSNGAVYVADSANNRVLSYSSLIFLPPAGGTPTGVVGQQNTSGAAPNWDSTDGQATPNGLISPLGLYMDRQDTLYVSDAGNHRVAQFLKPAAVVNAATFQATVPVAPGGLATLFSNGLTSEKVVINATTWPLNAVDRQLVINEQQAAPLYYIDGNQVNFQVPSNSPAGQNRIAVRVTSTGELVAGGSLLVASASPGLFTASQNGSGQALVLNQDNTINASSNPANQGSIIVLYGTGQGQVSPAVPDGTAAPAGGPLSNTVAVPTSDQRTCLNSQPSMCVVFGPSALGDVKYSGLAPGYIGLWQINVLVPSGVTGNVAVRVITNGAPSNTVTVAVR